MTLDPNKEIEKLGLYAECTKVINSRTKPIDIGHVLKGHSDYKVTQIIEGERELFIAIFEAEGKPPIMCCRATDPSRKHNLIDDLANNIGSHSFKRAKHIIEGVLKEFDDEGKQVILIGHSLGGALAQHITAHFPEYVEETYTFNAPGVGTKINKLFQKNTTDTKAPRVVHVRHPGDIVFFAGGQHIEPSLELKFWKNRKANALEAHFLGEGLQDMKFEEADRVRVMHRVFRVFIEPLRRGVVGRAAKAILKNKVAQNESCMRKINRLAKAIFRYTITYKLIRAISRP